VKTKRGTIRRVRHWQAIAEELSKAGFSWGWSSEIDSTGRVLYTADAYSRDGRRFTVLADERLSAFFDLQGAIQRQLEVGLEGQSRPGIIGRAQVGRRPLG